MSPQRIRQKREKGWRKPEGAVSVARPSKWGNPFVIGKFKQKRGGHQEYSVALNDGIRSFTQTESQARLLATTEYRRWLITPRPLDERRWHWRMIGRQSAILDNLHTLRGKDLMCFCPLDQPCHADVLLELANEGDSDDHE